MNKEKQIEEMSNEIYETLMLEAECPLSGMDCSIIADLLISKGYRKIYDDHQRQCTCYALGCQMAEELKRKVAREIFEEIEAIKCIGLLPSSWVKQFAELKKKYTEGER